MSDRASQFPIGASVSLDDLTNRLDEVLIALRQEGPISWLPVIEGWFVTGWASAVEVQRDSERFTVDDERFSTSQVVGPSMLSLDGSEHRLHRQPFVAPLLRSAVNIKLAPIVEQRASEIVEQIATRKSGTPFECDLRVELAAPLAVASILDVLGLPATTDETLSWYRSIVEAVESISAGHPPPAKGQQARSELAAAVKAASKQTASKQTATAQSAGMIKNIASAGVLNPDELAANVAVVMFGAIETGEGMIATLTYHLLTQPNWIPLLKEDPASIDSFVEESLRLEPAASVVDRYATTKSEISGVTIEAGELVRVSLTGANRDPAVFDRPEDFNPARSNLSVHLAFVQGPHACIGAHLARAEATIAVKNLLKSFPEIRAGEPEPPGPQGLIFRKPPRVLAQLESQ